MTETSGWKARRTVKLPVRLSLSMTRDLARRLDAAAERTGVVVPELARQALDVGCRASWTRRGNIVGRRQREVRSGRLPLTHGPLAIAAGCACCRWSQSERRRHRAGWAFGATGRLMGNAIRHARSVHGMAGRETP